VGPTNLRIKIMTIPWLICSGLYMYTASADEIRVSER